jgi:hypothetical protein
MRKKSLNTFIVDKFILPESLILELFNDKIIESYQNYSTEIKELLLNKIKDFLFLQNSINNKSYSNIFKQNLIKKRGHHFGYLNGAVVLNKNYYFALKYFKFFTKQNNYIGFNYYYKPTNPLSLIIPPKPINNDFESQSIYEYISYLYIFNLIKEGLQNRKIISDDNLSEKIYVETINKQVLVTHHIIDKDKTVLLYSKNFLFFEKFSAEYFYRLIKLKVPYFLIPTFFYSNKLIRQNIELYKKITINKKNKKRIVHNPHASIKEAQKIAIRFFDEYFQQKNINPNQFAYLKRRSTLDCMQLHSINRNIYRADIRNFFETISDDELFNQVAFLNEIEPSLRADLIYSLRENSNAGIYQGAPLSGIISNFVLAEPLIQIEDALNKDYDKPVYIVSAYADDIIISSDKWLDKNLLSNIVEFVLKNFNINYSLKKEKTFCFSKTLRKSLGISYNASGELTKPKKYRNEVYFRPLIEKYLNGKIKKKIFNRSVIGKLNECLRYEIFNFKNNESNSIDKYPLHRYIFSFKNHHLLNELGINFISKDYFY